MLGLLFHIDPHLEEFLHKNNMPMTNSIHVHLKQHMYRYVYKAKLLNH